MNKSEMFTVYTENQTYFDVRDLEDLIRMRGNRQDMSPTQYIVNQKDGLSVHEDDFPLVCQQ